jgi:hypothetical protein
MKIVIKLIVKIICLHEGMLIREKCSCRIVKDNNPNNLILNLLKCRPNQEFLITNNQDELEQLNNNRTLIKILSNLRAKREDDDLRKCNP